MENIKKFDPKVKKELNGYYKVNCKIYPYGMDYIPKKANEIYPLGKVVMCEIIDEIEVKLISTMKNDESWKASDYKDGWFEKFELADQISFFS